MSNKNGFGPGDMAILHAPVFSVIQRREDGHAFIERSLPMAFAKMDVAGWIVNQIVSAGIELSIFKIAPHSIYESHAVPWECLCIIAEGSGELFLTDEDGMEMSKLLCTKGDVYFQGADARHGFRNGSDETTLFYLTTSRSKEK